MSLFLNQNRCSKLIDKKYLQFYTNIFIYEGCSKNIASSASSRAKYANLDKSQHMSIKWPLMCRIAKYLSHNFIDLGTVHVIGKPIC